MNQPAPEDGERNFENVFTPLEESQFDASEQSPPEAALLGGLERVEEIPLPVTEFDCSVGSARGPSETSDRNGAAPPSPGAVPDPKSP
jgi:hypothetical protein